MHKSGTTLIADTLHRSGIPMVGAGAQGGYDDGNKMERAETRVLNMDLLGDDGIESFRLLQTAQAEAATTARRAKARALIESQMPGLWGFKDPRTLLTFRFWEEILEDPVLIGVFRDPVEVFGHYLKRAGRRWISRDPFYLPDALRGWCVYNRHLLEVKRRYPDMLLLDYAAFMSDDAGMDALSACVGRTLVDCRKPGMHRAKAIPSADYRLATLIVRLRDGLDPDRIHAQLQDAAA
jgi:hypothetical protein